MNICRRWWRNWCRTRLNFSSANTPVHVKLTESDNAVTLLVSDTGRGFSTEHISKVGAYMQFDRKLHEQQGLGLGLTIVRRLTEIHGGTLTIQSEKGTGTVVSVKFPRAVPESRGWKCKASGKQPGVGGLPGASFATFSGFTHAYGAAGE